MLKKNLFSISIVYMTVMFTVLICITGIALADISIDVYPLGMPSGTNPAKITFVGKEYAGGLWFDDISNNNIVLDADERFVFTVVAINTNGSKDSILNLWAPDERPEMSNIIYDDDIFQLNRNRYSQIGNTTFQAKILYGENTIFFMQHNFKDGSALVKSYVIKNIGGTYYLSGLISSDPLYSQIMMYYKNSLKIKIK